MRRIDGEKIPDGPLILSSGSRNSASHFLSVAMIALAACLMHAVSKVSGNVPPSDFPPPLRHPTCENIHYISCMPSLREKCKEWRGIQANFNT